MTERHYTEAVPALIAVIGIAIGGMALSWTCTRRGDQVAAQRVAQAVAERDSARAREVRLRDSAHLADALRDAAWNQYVSELQNQHQAELQESVQRAAARARRAVEARIGKPWQMAPDTGSGTPPCLVTLTCSEAAVLQASDSLLRVSADSTALQTKLSAAACTSAVAQAVATQEDDCASRLLQQGERRSDRSLSATAALVASASAATALVVIWLLGGR